MLEKEQLKLMTKEERKAAKQLKQLQQKQRHGTSNFNTNNVNNPNNSNSNKISVEYITGCKASSNSPPKSFLDSKVPCDTSEEEDTNGIMAIQELSAQQTCIKCNPSKPQKKSATKRLSLFFSRQASKKSSCEHEDGCEEAEWNNSFDISPLPSPSTTSRRKKKRWSMFAMGQQKQLHNESNSSATDLPTTINTNAVTARSVSPSARHCSKREHSAGRFSVTIEIEAHPSKPKVENYYKKQSVDIHELIDLRTKTRRPRCEAKSVLKMSSYSTGTNNPTIGGSKVRHADNPDDEKNTKPTLVPVKSTDALPTRLLDTRLSNNEYANYVNSKFFHANKVTSNIRRIVHFVPPSSPTPQATTSQTSHSQNDENDENDDDCVFNNFEVEVMTDARSPRSVSPFGIPSQVPSEQYNKMEQQRRHYDKKSWRFSDPFNFGHKDNNDCGEEGVGRKKRSSLASAVFGSRKLSLFQRPRRHSAEPTQFPSVMASSSTAKESVSSSSSSSSISGAEKKKAKADKKQKKKNLKRL
eukprot:m.129787 g.129787  ORF g.129787 m.129787 type:complete len:526 (-) comp9464_c0_seq4:121-1698(-)